MDKNMTYTTKDIYLSSFLIAMGFELQNLERGDDRRVRFVFNDSDKLQDLVKSYYAGKTKIEPFKFTVAMKQLKSQLYNLK